MNGYMKLGILFLVLLFVAPIGIGIYDMTGPAFTYSREIHSHMENAYYADEPKLMKSELLMAIEGMERLNLKEDMYSAFWYWEHTPDRKMDYQYKHLEGIVERIDAVITWYEKNYGENATGGTESLGDVFEQKMDNLRAFLKEEGWSDWIAQGTFYVNHHLFLYLWNGLILWIFIALMAVFGIVFLLVGFENY